MKLLHKKIGLLIFAGLFTVSCKPSGSQREAVGSPQQQINNEATAKPKLSEKEQLEFDLAALKTDEKAKEDRLTEVFKDLETADKAKGEIEKQSSGNGGIIKTIGSIVSTDAFQTIAGSFISPELVSIVSGVGSVVAGNGSSSNSEAKDDKQVEKELGEAIGELEKERDELQADLEEIRSDIKDAEAKLKTLG